MGKHYDGYSGAVRAVLAQGLAEDLALIDSLFGRDALRYGATNAEVKDEALRQLDREWTDPAWATSAQGMFVTAAVEAVSR